MTHTYKITGMTCEGCAAKVTHLLKQINDVTAVHVDLHTGEASIEMRSHIETDELRNALADYPKYQLSEQDINLKTSGNNIFEATPDDQIKNRSWFKIYKPIVLIFIYITSIALIVTLYHSYVFNWMVFMRIFMAGFFLTFSFFKMLDLDGFASSYQTYDIVAKKFRSWGYIYAFLELLLGLSFTLNIFPVFTNAFTAFIMTVSLIGVLQSVLNKKKIQCACLGAVFNLPMSTVTIIEDGLMIAMSIAMLFMYL